MEIETIATEWIQAKEAERQAVERRRKAEDELKRMLKITEHDEGTVSQKTSHYSIKAVCRMNRKIDSEKLLAIAGQCGCPYRPLPETMPRTAWRYRTRLPYRQWNIHS